MRKENLKDFLQEDLKRLLEELKERGFSQQGVSQRIGFDKKGSILNDSLRGKNAKKLNEACLLIQKEFSVELGVEPPDIEVVTMKSLDAGIKGLDAKLKEILAILKQD
jgi:hypothetical protein